MLSRSGLLAFVLLGWAVVACGQSPQSDAPGRITARPGPPTQACTPGLHPLGLGDGRDGVLFVPAAAKETKPLPLIVLLHGAGQDGRWVIRLMQSQAERDGFLLLAPDSRTGTWDAVRGTFDRDVVFLNSALEHIFARCAVAPAQVAIAGFSDGAGYALSLGLTNGDLFTNVMAFSPCFLKPAELRGKPAIFVSHGKHDKILPIDPCGRFIVSDLKRGGYRVRFRQFDGSHDVPPEVVEEALKNFGAGRRGQ